MPQNSPAWKARPLPDLQEMLVDISGRMNAAGFHNPRREASYLMKAVLGISQAHILDNVDMLDSAQCARLEDALEKRLGGMPLSKIIGRKGFWTHDFITSDSVLDPRPDTEILIEEVLAFIDGGGGAGRRAPLRLLDLGTGSGCILLSLLSELPQAQGIGVDISAEALDVAQKNAQKLGLESRVNFMRGHWCDALATDQVFDIVVSNPPYIKSQDIESLMPEVRVHEPILALDGGEDGLDAYKKIFADMPRVILPQSRIFVEIGTNQTDDILRLVKKYGFDAVKIKKDLGGINRVVSMALGES